MGIFGNYVLRVQRFLLSVLSLLSVSLKVKTCSALAMCDFGFLTSLLLHVNCLAVHILAEMEHCIFVCHLKYIFIRFQ
jgi:hypothetical protein